MYVCMQWTFQKARAGVRDCDAMLEVAQPLRERTSGVDQRRVDELTFTAGKTEQQPILAPISIGDSTLILGASASDLIELKTRNFYSLSTYLRQRALKT